MKRFSANLSTEACERLAVLKIRLGFKSHEQLLEYLIAGEALIPSDDRDALLSAFKPKVSGYTPEFEKFWEAYPERAGNTAKSVAFEAYQRVVSNGLATPEQLLENVKAYRQYCNKHHLLNTPYVKLASTYLNQRAYECDWAEQELKWE